MPVRREGKGIRPYASAAGGWGALRATARAIRPLERRTHALFAGLLSMGLCVPALARSVPYPTYAPGENASASTGRTYSQPSHQPWVVSDGTIITPVGTQVYLGITSRAKAIARNPTGNHTAAVLQMGAPQAVTIFNIQTGAVLQTYSVPYTNSKGGTSFDSDVRFSSFIWHTEAGCRIAAISAYRS